MQALRSTLVAGILLSVALAGCAGAAVPPAASSPPPTDAPPTQVPGGGSVSQPPGGAVIDPAPGGGGGTDPGNPGGANFRVANPGKTINPRPVAIQLLEVKVEGRRVSVIATWTSGVEPCYVLDTVAVKQDGSEFTIALTEGAGQADAMCIEIAQEKATLIDLGELPPGNYVVAAQEETAPAVPFTVS